MCLTLSSSACFVLVICVCIYSSYVSSFAYWLWCPIFFHSTKPSTCRFELQQRSSSNNSIINVLLLLTVIPFLFIVESETARISSIHFIQLVLQKLCSTPPPTVAAETRPAHLGPSFFNLIIFLSFKFTKVIDTINTSGNYAGFLTSSSLASLLFCL